MHAKRNKIAKRFIKSIWAFPLVLLFLLIAFTAFKISGSSVGVYHDLLYGTETKDPNLLYGKPRYIRADEWQGGTQLIVSQSKIGYPTHDLTFPGGQDVSLNSGMPTKDWPTIFRPNLWGYLLLPVEFALAFNWWLIMYLLIISCYFFVLRMLPGDRLFAALVGLAFGLSPFFLWWYAAASFMPAAYGFMMLILGMRILNSEPIGPVKNQRINNVLYVLSLAFVISSFGLILYPPFQIPIALVVAAFFAGYVLQKKYMENAAWKILLRRAGLALIGIVIAGAIGILFIQAHQTPINALNNTIYPGHRTITSGGFSALNVFDGFVMPLLQSDLRGAHFIVNQSESSNFILLLPFLIAPAAFLMLRRWRRSRKINWIYLALNACALMFFANLFIPPGNFIYKLLLLNRVPHQRLLIGLGFLGIIQLALTVRFIKEEKIPQNKLWKLAGVYSAICFAVLIATGAHIRANYPIFLHNYILIVALAFAFTSILLFVLVNRKILAATLLLIFTLASSFQIIPLYRGLGELTHGKVFVKMQDISPKNATWIVVGDDAYDYNEFAAVAGRPTLSGIQSYSHLDFWRQAGDPNYNYVTNREAHIVFTDNPDLKMPLRLLHNNSFNVKFECSDFIKNHVQYALSVHRLSEPCVRQIDSTSYPKVTFYMYRVK